MDQKKMLRNQQGFTLIEIIAVLVLLGILAAVAVPKFMDMQGTSQQKAVDGAIAAASSNASMSYSKFLLDYSTAPTGITTNSWGDGTNTLAIETDLGDFTSAYSYSAGDVTVTISGKSGVTDWVTGVTNKTKTFKIQ